jgi:hypothetical protein
MPKIRGHLVQCLNPWPLKPRVTLGFNTAESWGKLGIQISKDSDTVHLMLKMSADVCFVLMPVDLESLQLLLLCQDQPGLHAGRQALFVAAVGAPLASFTENRTLSLQYDEL